MVDKTNPARMRLQVGSIGRSQYVMWPGSETGWWNMVFLDHEGNRIGHVQHTPYPNAALAQRRRWARKRGEVA